MSKEARKHIWKQIKKREKKIREIRRESSEDKTYVQEILKFLNNLDIISAMSENELEFSVAMERECELLDSRLKRFDRNAEVKVHWNTTDNWKELKPLGVHLYWSKYYLNLHPDVDEHEYIDFGRILLDDY